MRERKPDVAIAIADVPGAALYSYYTTGELKAEGSSITEGIGQGRVTANLEGLSVDEAFFIEDQESLSATLALVHDEGLNVGLSTGVNVAGAIRLARKLGPGKTIVTMLCDPGDPLPVAPVQPGIPALEGRSCRPNGSNSRKVSNLTWCRTIGAPSQLSGRHTMTLSIGSIAPDFTADTTQGPINFHDCIGDGYAILFSHPKDYTPVCTTELGYMAGLADEFAKRNTKVIGLSVDPVGAHEGWPQDIKDVTGNEVNFPMIGDHDLKVAKLYNMLPADAGETSEGRTAANNATVRTVYIVGPGQADQGDAHLSDEHGPQLRRSAAPARLHPADRQAFGGDAGQLEAGRGLHHRPVAQRRGRSREIPERLEDGEALSAHGAAAAGPKPRDQKIEVTLTE